MDIGSGKSEGCGWKVSIKWMFIKYGGNVWNALNHSRFGPVAGYCKDNKLFDFTEVGNFFMISFRRAVLHGSC
jgi:hypothetical protein